MIITRLILKNWRNFRDVDVKIGKRVFLVGQNASGKSNFLDVFRFLRDIAKPGGGLQKAVKDRGGISKIRCFSARTEPQIEITIHLMESFESNNTWRYEIGIKQESRGFRTPYLTYERVYKNDRILANRPNNEDKKDIPQLTQTHLEQINANQKFRIISDYFTSICYMHIVPQLLRHPDTVLPDYSGEDPFGKSFLEKVAQTPEKTRRARLRKIEEALRIAVPQLKQLSDSKDLRGIPHLEAVYEHWRPKAGKQTEEDFSDGTLRLIGLLWSLLDGDSLLLLEEPELSLHTEIVRRLPSLIWRVQNKKRRQIILSTHSYELLQNDQIGGEETLILKPSPEGTCVSVLSNIKEAKLLLEGGLTVADAALPRTKPQNINQLDLFNE